MSKINRKSNKNTEFDQWHNSFFFYKTMTLWKSYQKIIFDEMVEKCCLIL